MSNIFSKSFEYFTKNIFSIFLISILASIFSEVNIFYKFTLNNTARLLSLTILGNGIIGTFVANYAKIEIYNSIKENRNPSIINAIKNFFDYGLGQFTRNYTQTVKRAADNKRRYAPGEGSIPPVLLSGVSKGVPPLAHDFACKV